MVKITFDEFNKDIDKYFNIAVKDKVVVEIEENKNIIILSEKEYNKLKDKQNAVSIWKGEILYETRN